MIIICGQCKKHKKKSTIRLVSQDKPAQKLDIYWDEEGRQHFHNSNYNDEQYKCSNGHTFNIVYYPPDCPICGWKTPTITPEKAH